MPSYTELSEAGLDLEDEEEPDPGVVVGEVEGSVGWPEAGVKLGGWIRWCQGVEYPQCPTCDRRMTVPCLQLEPSPALQFEWGDAGSHISTSTTTNNTSISSTSTALPQP